MSRTFGVLTAMFVFAGLLLPVQRDRITGAINSNQRVVLKGNVHPKAQAQYDQGVIDPAFQIGSAMLVLKPSAAQQEALEQLLADQQNPSSPNFHKWITPEQFADQFSVTGRDAAKIVPWLESQGLTVNGTARGRGFVSFSGTAAQVSRALRTEIRRYKVNGEMHFANATEPSVPAALADAVAGFRGLNDFRLKPRVIRKNLRPGYTLSDGSHAIGPDDLAAIYNISPLYSAGIDGTGQKIAIVGQTDINLSDIQGFRNRFGLPVNNPQVVLVPTSYGGTDPGISQTGDLEEADLDLEFSGAVARKASIIYVNSQSVILSMIYAIDQNVAPVLSMSYGACEQESDPTLQFTAQQAVAQGMTFVAVSGDSGAADCDGGDFNSQASKGKSVDLPAGIPEVTAVGGTQFNEGGGNYWGAGNNANGASALSYIPEMVWNESDETGLAAGGGGASTVFAKPVWQAGAGVPNDNARDVPDVALAAASGHDGFLLYTGGFLQCCVGGTSAGAPSFAGIVALLNHYVSNHGGQAGLGNINPALYRLAQTTPNAFHDVTAGSNMVPCVQGSPDCSNGLLGYSAAPGYDQAAGLGSVDANNLVTSWNNATAGTTMSLTVSPATVSFSSTAQLTATVTSSNGGTPTGTVSFVCDAAPLVISQGANSGTPLGTAPLSGTGSSATATLNLNTDLLQNTNDTIYAVYNGDSNLSGSSATAKVAVSVSGSAVVASIYPNPIYPFTPDSTGNEWFVFPTLTNLGATRTTLTDFKINGVSFASQLANIFGVTSLSLAPSVGQLVGGDVAIPNISAPGGSVAFVFSGTDAGGKTWTRQFSVPVLNQPLVYSAMALTGAPATVFKSSNAACPYALQLNLQEQGGFEIFLSDIRANGLTLGTRATSATSLLQQIFGSTMLAPYGSLAGTFCIASAPSSLNLEIDGTDEQGNSLAAALTATFSTSLASGGALSASPSPVTMSAIDSSQSASADVQVSLDSSAQWSVSVFPANRTTSWLTVSPGSGTGPAQINVQASAAGLSNGVYRGVLVIQSNNANPQMINVPVAFVVGPSGGSSIGGVSNAASFQATFAPGMLMSVFGAGLSQSTQAASFIPLPLSAAGVSATVNGISAPLWYISPEQLNIQIPYEAGAGPAVLGVNNNGQVSSFVFQVSPAAPGIFGDTGGNIVPSATAKRGQTVTLYITGEGELNQTLQTGWTPDPSTAVRNLPRPMLPVAVTVGGVAATTTFVGMPSGFVGVTQINYTVPSSAPLGVQPVVVTVGTTASQPAKVNVQ